jgi:6-phosphogluconolactonase
MTEEVRTIDYGERGKVLIVPDGDALARAAANLIVSVADDAAAESRRSLVALSGGSTPKNMGALFAVEPLRNRVHWQNLEIFWGDERWVPHADPESNAGEARRGFLDRVSIPPRQVHPFATEGVEPEASARAMQEVIANLAPGDGIPRFDLILLGMGDDGHTASLFPGTAPIHETRALVVSHWVDKLNTTRLTFTPTLINAAGTVAFLVGGAGKAGMLAKVLDGPIDVDLLPSQVVRPASGELLWLVDDAAAASLARNTEHG